ncbi:DUF2690 domain-containing protein [Microbacterium sp. B2969]|uniref:DUF2690 domain-containing protein n=1 Tax=Microbacterium alkaliflavum TaxID=3248839 RepID=A0ABW7QDL3_9MICO
MRSENKKIRAMMVGLLGVAIALSGVAVASPAVAASTSYQGGDGDPSTCTNAYTVKSAPIYGQRGVTAGKQIGVLELRYSSGCRANWSRVTLYQQSFTSPILIQQDLNTEGRWTTTSDYGLSVRYNPVTKWGRYIRLQNVNSTACVQTWISSDFGTLNYHTVGARVCA